MAKRQSESLNEAIVIAVLKGGMSTKVAGEQFGVSQRWVRALVRRARLEGMEAVRKKSRRPHTNPRATAQEVRDRIVFLRNELTRAGLDAGPESIWEGVSNGLCVGSVVKGHDCDCDRFQEDQEFWCL